MKGIKENVVIVRDDKAGEKMLVAFYITDGSKEVTQKEIRQYLKERLPDYMIPAAFVILERFPLTSTLKVDRNALPIPTWMAQGNQQDMLPRRPKRSKNFGILVIAAEPEKDRGT